MSEQKKYFETLEKKIQKLISSHQQLKEENKNLAETNKRLEETIKSERGKTGRIEEGYERLRESEKTKSHRQVVLLKQKINEMVSELDKSVALINDKHKK